MFGGDIHDPNGFQQDVQRAIEDRPLDSPGEIHSEEYGTSGYTRLCSKRDVGRLDDALEDEELKQWAVDGLAEFHKQLTPVSDEELR